MYVQGNNNLLQNEYKNVRGQESPLQYNPNLSQGHNELVQPRIKMNEITVRSLVLASVMNLSYQMLYS